MRILLTGATGFIGSALADRLARDGHALRLVVRDPRRAAERAAAEIVAGDFASLTTPDAWQPLLAGVDAVVNAVGIIRETKRQRFAILHVDAPLALFEACAKAGVERVIQISALGADADARSAYHLSKRAADEALEASSLQISIVQPSLVFGAGGASAALFERLALMPWIPLPGEGGQRVQPIHIDDLCDALAILLSRARMPQRLAAVGPRCMTLREYLATLRASLDGGPARFVRVPRRLVAAAARTGDAFPAVPFDSDRHAMLERGNCADAGEIAALLGRAPRDAAHFIVPRESRERASLARFDALRGALRASVALVWLASGAVSLGIWPVEDSLALLARCGLHGTLALIALYGAAAIDLAFGAGTLVLRRRKRLYEAQIVVIVAYSVLVAAFLPEFLRHPFAPIAKNLPMLAAIWLLRETER